MARLLDTFNRESWVDARTLDTASSCVPDLSIGAAAVHLSPRGLTKAFVAATGMTPLQYQQNLRLDLAANLLRDTTTGIEEISTRCGFADPRHFRRLFAERAGLSPSRYRPLSLTLGLGTIALILGAGGAERLSIHA